MNYLNKIIYKFIIYYINNVNLTNFHNYKIKFYIIIFKICNVIFNIHIK